MIHHYDILTRVEIRHEYFRNDLLKSAIWSPSGTTSKTLRNLGLSYKASNGTLKILTSIEEKEDGSIILDERLSDPFQLTFLIQFNQVYWSNFSTISANGNQVFCFYNRDLKDNAQALLHDQTAAAAEDLTFKCSQSHYPLQGFITEDIQILRAGDDTNVATYALKEINSESFLETRLLEEGLYTITDTQNKSTSLFINTDKPNPQAICHLIFDKNWGDTVQTDRSWKTQNFQINFESLHNHWRYYFPLEKIQEYEGVRVLNGVREEVFDQGEQIEVSGRDMLRFTSLAPIKMVQHGDQTFQLKRNVGVSNRSEGVIVDRLPQPQTQDLFRLDSEGNRYSDIYINL